MKQRELVNAGSARVRKLNCRAELRICKLGLKSIVPVNSKRVLVAEAIVGQCISFVDERRHICHSFSEISSCCFLLPQHTG